MLNDFQYLGSSKSDPNQRHSGSGRITRYSEKANV